MSYSTKEYMARKISLNPPKGKNIEIPFGKPARIRNFKIWRSNFQLSVEPTEEQRKKVSAESNGKKRLKRQNFSIECINLSLLDGSFSVRIPQTFEMFGMMTAAYQWLHSDDEGERKRGEDFLIVAANNIFYVSSICNGFYHHGVNRLTAAYADPSLLRDTEDGKKFMEDLKVTVERFLVWREEYEKHVKENEPTEQDLHQEDLAEQAMDIVNGKSDEK